MTHRPMKFKAVDPATLDRFMTSSFVFQQKADGVRAQLVIDFDGHVWARSGLGTPLKSTTAAPITDPILAAVQSLPDDQRSQLHGITLDGEVVDGAWWMFDLIAAGQDEPYIRRLDLLRAVIPAWNLHPTVRVLPTAVTLDQKMRLLDHLVRINGEGVMIKDVESLYRPNARVSDCLKAKFVKTADVVIIDRNVGSSVKVGSAGSATDKLNAVFGVYDSAGSLITLGQCSMVGKPDARPGDVVEMRYLYLGAGNKLVQPSLLRMRGDKMPEECTLDQFRAMTRSILREDDMALRLFTV